MATTVDLGKYVLPRQFTPGMSFDEQKEKQLEEILRPIYWLLNTNVSKTLKSLADEKALSMIQDSNGDYAIAGIPTFNTTPPTSTTGECCWDVMGMTACENKLVLDMLCVKKCFDELLTEYNKVSSGTDLNLAYYLSKFNKNTPNRFERAVKLMLQENFLFRFAYQLWLGDPAHETPLSKPFHGVESIMSSTGVREIYGGNPISAMKSLACRYEAMGIDNAVAMVHPLGFESILSYVQSYNDGRLPDGWTYNANTGLLRYKNIVFMKNIFVGINKTAGTYDIQVMTSDAIGALTTTPIDQPNLLVENSFNKTPNADGSCGGVCYYGKGAGGVVATNFYELINVVELPLDSACLDGVNDLADIPDTFVPVPY